MEKTSLPWWALCVASLASCGGTAESKAGSWTNLQPDPPEQSAAKADAEARDDAQPVEQGTLDSSTPRESGTIADAPTPSLDDAAVPVTEHNDAKPSFLGGVTTGVDLSALKGQLFTVGVKAFGGSRTGYLTPQVTSSVLRFIGIDDTPSSLQTPGGPVTIFRFEALAAGEATVTVSRDQDNDGGGGLTFRVLVHE